MDKIQGFRISSRLLSFLKFSRAIKQINKKNYGLEPKRILRINTKEPYDISKTNKRTIA